MVLFIFALLATPVFASVEKLSLKEALSRASRENKELKAQRVQVDQAEADLGRARGEFGPRLEGLLGVGPITKAEGNSTFVIEDRGIWGRTIFGKISFTQPIYTWGRKSDYEAAASSGVRVKEIGRAHV